MDIWNLNITLLSIEANRRKTTTNDWFKTLFKTRLNRKKSDLQPIWQYDRSPQRGANGRYTGQSRAKTENRFLFNCLCKKKKRNVFCPRPVLVPLQLSLSSSTHHHHPLIPLIFFPSQPSCSLHTLGLSQLPCPHNYHHHWECGKRVQSPTPGRGCRPRWSQPQNPSQNSMC